MYKFLSILLLISFDVLANERLYNEFERIEKDAEISLGITAIHLESGEKISYHGDERFRMASTVKLPIAAYFLKLEDENKVSLNKMIDIKQSDLVPGSGKLGYFLTRDGLKVSNYNLLEPMITVSDNSATDIILSQVGGPKKVREFLQNNNINDIYVARSILQLYIDSSGLTQIPAKKDWSIKKWQELFNNVPLEKKQQAELRDLNDLRDTTTSDAMADLMAKIMKAEILSFKNTILLQEIMNRSENRSMIRSAISNNVKSGNKSGGWWNNSDKKNTHINDVGYIILPDNAGTVVIAAYSSGRYAHKVETHNNAIARASKTIYDYFYLKH